MEVTPDVAQQVELQLLDDGRAVDGTGAAQIVTITDDDSRFDVNPKVIRHGTDPVDDVMNNCCTGGCRSKHKRTVRQREPNACRTERTDEELNGFCGFIGGYK